MKTVIYQIYIWFLFFSGESTVELLEQKRFRPKIDWIGYHAITDVKSITITIEAIQNNRCGCEKSQRDTEMPAHTHIFTPHISKYGIRK